MGHLDMKRRWGRRVFPLRGIREMNETISPTPFQIGQGTPWDFVGGARVHAVKQRFWRNLEVKDRKRDKKK